MGLSLSYIAIKYTLATIIMPLMSTTVLFAVMILWGYFTKVNLLKYSHIFLNALFSLIIILFIGIFIQSDLISMGISALAVIIFAALTAYDIQKLRNRFDTLESDDAAEIYRISIISALELYLDFINIFSHMLRLGR